MYTPNAKVNAIHNFAKPGPETSNSMPLVLYSDLAGNNCSGPSAYLEGNLGSKRVSQNQDDWDSANWVIYQPKMINEPLNLNCKQDTPFNLLGWGSITNSIMSNNYAEQIINNSGANKCSTNTNCRDSVDERVINDFIFETGSYPDTVVFPDDYPTFQNLSPPVDSDNDGMSDAWETSRYGDLSRDNNGDEDSDGYTNLEEYLHFLAGDVSEEPVVNNCDFDNDGLDSLNVSCGGTDCDDNDPSVLECHKADTSYDNCVSVTELASHLNLWMSSSSVSIRDVISAVSIFKVCN